MLRSPFDFNCDGEMDSFERAAEFAFLNDLLHTEDSDELDFDYLDDSETDDE